MKITLFPDKCIACGLCQIKAPEIFDYHDNGIVKFSNAVTSSDGLALSSPQLSQENTANLCSAVKACPTRAIKMSTE